MMNHGITFDNELLCFLKTGKRMRLFTPEELALGGSPAPAYRYIDPIDPVAFPVYNGLIMLTLDGSETWSLAGGGCYTSAYGDIIKNQRRDSVVGFCADYTFYLDIKGLADLPQNGFMFNGTTSTPVNGNLSFKNEHTTSAAAWKAWLSEHPLTILISVNAPDASEWKPALREAENATGYWNGANGFVEVYGGIPYLGENLVTQEVIANKYSAYITASGSNQVWKVDPNGSPSVRVDVQSGHYYRLLWDTTASTVVGTIYRWGFTDIDHPSNDNSNILTDWVRSSPQDSSDVTVLTSGAYMPIQFSGATFPGNAAHLSVREMIGYQPPMMMAPRRDPEPEPEELTEEDGE